MKTFIGFRLRKELDADILAALALVNGSDISETCRNGLRIMLGIRTTKRIDIVEHTLEIPQTKTTPIEITSNSAVWKPVVKR